MASVPHSKPVLARLNSARGNNGMNDYTLSSSVTTTSTSTSSSSLPPSHVHVSAISNQFNHPHQTNSVSNSKPPPVPAVADPLKAKEKANQWMQTTQKAVQEQQQRAQDIEKAREAQDGILARLAEKAGTLVPVARSKLQEEVQMLATTRVNTVERDEEIARVKEVRQEVLPVRVVAQEIASGTLGKSRPSTTNTTSTNSNNPSSTNSGTNTPYNTETNSVANIRSRYTLPKGSLSTYLGENNNNNNSSSNNINSTSSSTNVSVAPSTSSTPVPVPAVVTVPIPVPVIRPPSPLQQIATATAVHNPGGGSNNHNFFEKNSSTLPIGGYPTITPITVIAPSIPAPSSINTVYPSTVAPSSQKPITSVPLPAPPPSTTFIPPNNTTATNFSSVLMGNTVTWADIPQYENSNNSLGNTQNSNKSSGNVFTAASSSPPSLHAPPPSTLSPRLNETFKPKNKDDKNSNSFTIYNVPGAFTGANSHLRQSSPTAMNNPLSSPTDINQLPHNDTHASPQHVAKPVRPRIAPTITTATTGVWGTDTGGDIVNSAFTKPIPTNNNNYNDNYEEEIPTLGGVPSTQPYYGTNHSNSSAVSSNSSYRGRVNNNNSQSSYNNRSQTYNTTMNNYNDNTTDEEDDDDYTDDDDDYTEEDDYTDDGYDNQYRNVPSQQRTSYGDPYAHQSGYPGGQTNGQLTNNQMNLFFKTMNPEAAHAMIQSMNMQGLPMNSAHLPKGITKMTVPTKDSRYGGARGRVDEDSSRPSYLNQAAPIMEEVYEDDENDDDDEDYDDEDTTAAPPSPPETNGEGYVSSANGPAFFQTNDEDVDPMSEKQLALFKRTLIAASSTNALLNAAVVTAELERTQAHLQARVITRSHSNKKSRLRNWSPNSDDTDNEDNSDRTSDRSSETSGTYDNENSPSALPMDRAASRSPSPIRRPLPTGPVLSDLAMDEYAVAALRQRGLTSAESFYKSFDDETLNPVPTNATKDSSKKKNGATHKNEIPSVSRLGRRVLEVVKNAAFRGEDDEDDESVETKANDDFLASIVPELSSSSLSKPGASLLPLSLPPSLMNKTSPQSNNLFGLVKPPTASPSTTGSSNVRVPSINETSNRHTNILTSPMNTNDNRTSSGVARVTKSEPANDKGTFTTTLTPQSTEELLSSSSNNNNNRLPMYSPLRSSMPTNRRPEPINTTNEDDEDGGEYIVSSPPPLPVPTVTKSIPSQQKLQQQSQQRPITRASVPSRSMVDDDDAGIDVSALLVSPSRNMNDMERRLAAMLESKYREAVGGSMGDDDDDDDDL